MKYLDQHKKPSNLFSQLNAFEAQIKNLEDKILNLEKRLQDEAQLQRSNLIRIKNKEHLTDQFIYKGYKYLDLSPSQAFSLYSDPEKDLIFVDVSSQDFKSRASIPELIHIPWEEFPSRFFEIKSKTTPIFIISEDGTKSILACKFLAKLGYYNCNNISGGHLFWPETSPKIVDKSS